jgi:hypothetical protein
MEDTNPGPSLTVNFRTGAFRIFPPRRASTQHDSHLPGFFSHDGNVHADQVFGTIN